MMEGAAIEQADFSDLADDGAGCQIKDPAERAVSLAQFEQVVAHIGRRFVYNGEVWFVKRQGAEGMTTPRKNDPNPPPPGHQQPRERKLENKISSVIRKERRFDPLGEKYLLDPRMRS